MTHLIQPGDKLALKWTPEQDLILVRLHGQGFSASEISAAIRVELGVLYSRNAVIGRAHRTGLVSSKKPNKPTAKRVRVYVPREKAAEPVLRQDNAAPLHLSFDQVAGTSCRWPYGDGPFTWCGCPQAPDKPYCWPHAIEAVRGKPESLAGATDVRP